MIILSSGIFTLKKDKNKVKKHVFPTACFIFPQQVS